MKDIKYIFTTPPPFEEDNEQTRSPGRPPQYDEPMTIINVHMPAEMVAWLDAQAERLHTSRASMMRLLVEQEMHTERINGKR